MHTGNVTFQIQVSQKSVIKHSTRVPNNELLAWAGEYRVFPASLCKTLSSIPLYSPSCFGWQKPLFATVFLCLPPYPFKIWHFLSVDSAHVAVFVQLRACKNFPASLHRPCEQRSHRENRMVNDNQTAILLLSLLNI